MIPAADTLLIFTVASTIACLIPGPAIIYAVLQTTSKGVRSGMNAVWGLQAGFLLQVLAAACGLSVLIIKYSILFYMLKIIGAAYLIYLGLSFVLKRDKKEDGWTGFLNHDTGKATFLKGVFINVLNPKIAVFFISYLPQFVDEAAGAPISQIFILGLLFSLIGTAVCIFYVVIAAKASDRLALFFKSSVFKKWLPGSVFIGFGVKLAFTDES